MAGRRGPILQSVERVDLNSIQSGFEPQWAYHMSVAIGVAVRFRALAQMCRRALPLVPHELGLMVQMARKCTETGLPHVQQPPRKGG